MASLQNAYNLVNRTFEVNLAEVCEREDVGLLAYSPLAQGYLTGKYDHGARPEGARTHAVQPRPALRDASRGRSAACL